MEMTQHNVLLKIKEYFDIRAKDADENYNSNGDRNIYYKWVAGWGLAQHIGWNVDALRKMCRQMEKAGLLTSIKKSGAVLWTCPMDGYLQHEVYTDSYYRVKGTCFQESCKPLFTGCNVEGEAHICKCTYFTQTNQEDATKR